MKSIDGCEIMSRLHSESVSTEHGPSNNDETNIWKEVTKQEQSKSKASKISCTKLNFQGTERKLQLETSCEEEVRLQETKRLDSEENRKEAALASKELRGTQSLKPCRINSKNLTQTVNDSEDSLHSELVDAVGIQKAKTSLKGSRCKGTKVSKSLQNLVQIEKRVTRSQSQMAFQSMSEHDTCTSIDLTALAQNQKYFHLCKKPRNPDANNSAALDITENNQLFESKNKTHFETLEASERVQNNEHCPYDFSTGSNFKTGSIEVKITPKKKKTDDNFSDDILQREQIPLNSKSMAQPKKCREKQELKTSLAKIPDKIPDLLKVKINKNNSDTASFMNKKQSSKMRCKSKTEKQVNKQEVTDDDRPRESAMVTKSLELNIPRMNLNVDTKAIVDFPHKAKRVKNVERKERYEKRIPEVVGLRIQSSPVKRTERSTCKSAGKLQGHVNKIPNKPLSARFGKTGQLPAEIVSNLKQQASNSICSIVGNSDAQTLKSIIANGKEVISARKPRNKDFSEFQTDCIRMWQNTLKDDDDVDNVSSDRNCKSAEVTGRTGRNRNYRPTSSIYHPSYSNQKHKHIPSIKTGIGALLSREKNKAKSKKDQMEVESSSAKITTKTGSLKVVSPNYGSSSSKTPDIYDEFARRKMTRTCKPDVQRTKGRKHSYEPDGSVTTILGDKVYSKSHSHQKACQSNTEDENLPASLKVIIKSNAKIINRKCNMCRQESNMKNYPNNSHWSCSVISNHSDDDNSLTIADNQFNLYNCEESRILNDVIKRNVSNMEDSEKNETTVPQEEMTIPLESPMCSDSLTDIEHQPLSSGRLSLLEKVNLFVDGIYKPETCESLEDIDNIKSVIRINPVEASQPESHGVHKSPSEQMQKTHFFDNYNYKKMFSEESRLDLGENRNISTKFKGDTKLEKYLGIPYPNMRYSFEGNQEKQPNADMISHTKSLTFPRREKYHSIKLRLSRLKQEIEEQTESKSDEIVDVESSRDDCKDNYANVRSEFSSANTDNEEDLRATIDNFSMSTERHVDKLWKDPLKHDESLERMDTFQESPNHKGCGLVNKTKGNTFRVNEPTKKNKTFREVVEEKRAAKRKADRDLSKKKYWKSASTKSASSDNQVGMPRVTTYGQKTELRTLKDWDSDVAESDSRKPNTNKTKRQRTLKAGKFKGSLTETPIQGRNTDHGAGESDNPIGNCKINKPGKELEDICDASLDSKLKTLRKPKYCPRPKTVEPKTTSERILRPRAVTSARASRRSRKESYREMKEEKRTEKEIGTDSKLYPIMHDNNMPEPSVPCSRSVSRQKKLRKKVQNSVLKKKKTLSQTDRESLQQVKIRDNSLSSESKYEQVDDSNIVCETVPYENILEPNLEPTDEDNTDIFTKTFITQCSTQDFQSKNQEHNKLCTVNTENLPHTEMNVTNSSLNGVDDKQMYTSNTSENLQLQYNHIEETGHKNEAEHNEEEERVSHYLFYQDKNGVSVLLCPSELPQVVSDIVYSDQLMDVSGNQVIHYGMADEQYAVADSNQQIVRKCEKENDLLSIMHPGGTKLVLNEDNPDIHICPQMFLQEKPHDQKLPLIDQSHLDCHSLELSVGHFECAQDHLNKRPTMITDDCHEHEYNVVTEPSQQYGDSYCDSSEILPSVCHLFLQSNQQSDKCLGVKNLEVLGMPERTDSNQEGILSSMTNVKSISTCHPNTYNNSDGKIIGEVCQYEFGQITDEQELDYAQLELFPETIVEDKETDEVVYKYINLEKEIRSKYVDFEHELIKMIKENFSDNAASLKEDRNSKGEETVPKCLNCTPNLSTFGKVFQQQIDPEGANNSIALNLMDTKTRLLGRFQSNEEKSEMVDMSGREEPGVVVSKFDEVGSMNQYGQTDSSGALDLRINKTSKKNESNHSIQSGVSESESSKTYDYSARSFLDLYEFDSNTSDETLAGDEDYYPETDESDDSVYREDLSRVKNKHRAMKYFVDCQPRIRDKKNDFKDKKQIATNQGAQIECESKSGKKCKRFSDHSIPQLSHKMNLGHINKKTRKSSKSLTENCAENEHIFVNSELSEIRDSEESTEVEHDIDYNRRSKRAQKRRGRKKSSNWTSYDKEVEASIDEEEETVEETVSAKNMVAMQKLYFDVLKNSSGMAEIDNQERYDLFVENYILVPFLVLVFDLSSLGKFEIGKMSIFPHTVRKKYKYHGCNNTMTCIFFVCIHTTFI